MSGRASTGVLTSSRKELRIELPFCDIKLSYEDSGSQKYGSSSGRQLHRGYDLQISAPQNPGSCVIRVAP